MSASAPEAVRARWGHRGACLRRPRAFTAAKPAAGGPSFPFQAMAQPRGGYQPPGSCRNLVPKS